MPGAGAPQLRHAGQFVRRRQTVCLGHHRKVSDARAKSEPLTGSLRAMSWSIRAMIPRRMLTSSFSSPARAKSRRNRGSSFFGMPG